MKLKLRSVASLAALSLVAACSEAPAETSEQETTSESADAAAAEGELDPAAFADALEAGGDEVILLDVRTPEEFAEGHLEGAANIDFNAADFADQVAALDPAQDYLLYCRSDTRSGMARQLMLDAGFVNVRHLDGGILAWQEDGLPVAD